MEPLWSPVVATVGNPLRISRPLKPPKKAPVVRPSFSPLGTLTVLDDWIARHPKLISTAHDPSPFPAGGRPSGRGRLERAACGCVEELGALRRDFPRRRPDEHARLHAGLPGGSASRASCAATMSRRSRATRTRSRAIRPWPPVRDRVMTGLREGPTAAARVAVSHVVFEDKMPWPTRGPNVGGTIGPTRGTESAAGQKVPANEAVERSSSPRVVVPDSACHAGGRGFASRRSRSLRPPLTLATRDARRPHGRGLLALALHFTRSK
jgi:hypothetical protein